MLLGHNKIVTETLFTKVLAVFLLGLLYFLGLVFITIFEALKKDSIDNPSAGVFAYLGLYSFVTFIVTLAVALPVLRTRKRRLLQDTDNNI